MKTACINQDCSGIQKSNIVYTEKNNPKKQQSLATKLMRSLKKCRLLLSILNPFSGNFSTLARVACIPQ